MLSDKFKIAPRNKNINMGEMDVGMYDAVSPEDSEDIIEHEETEEIMPPCKECEKHFYYRKSTFNHFDALFVLISMGTLVADIATDTLVTVQYFKSPKLHSNAWASLTLAFTLGPSIVMQIFSASWYVADEDMTKCRWIIHLFQLSPVQRYIRVFRTGLIARKSDDPIDFQRLHHQQSDVAMLRLFEAFLESAPQVVLQLYIIMATQDENTFTGISAVVSLFSLCWAMVAYSKNHRKVRNDKNVMSVPGLVLQTIWRIGMISSRVMALVLLATFTQLYVFVFAAIHWFCMTIWVYIQNTEFCDSWVEERIFNGVIGVIYIFCFFNLKEGNSRFRVTFFYAMMFGENVILVIVWWFKYRDNELVESWYDSVGFGIVFGGFAIGVSSMLLYYRFFHPRGSGAILLFKKKKKDDKHHLHPTYRSPRTRLPDQAEISRRSRSPTPRNSPHKHSGTSPLTYYDPVATRSLTPCKYSPLKSEGELPYDRYGMRRGPHRSQSEACIDSFHGDSITPATQRMGRVYSDNLCTHDKTPIETANFEFSGFATDLVKQFDKKMDNACTSAISNCNCSYGSYGFDVEAQTTSHSHSDMSCTESQHKVMVHASSSSQPDMRQVAKTTVNEIDQSSVLLEPIPSTAKRGGSLSKIKSAYEVQNMYHEMMDEERPKRTSKRQLMFGQANPSPSPPISSNSNPSPHISSVKKRTPSPMCPYHKHLSAQKSRSLPPPKQQAWEVCEINSEPQRSHKSQNVSRGLPKVPLKPERRQSNLNKLKIPHDTSKAERAMLKCGEKRKFSFREKVPAASLKAMRFTPLAPRMAPPGHGGVEPGTPLWKLRDLNARLWQPKTVDIYNPNLHDSPQPKVVAQRVDSLSNSSAGKSNNTNHTFSFNSELDSSSPQFGNFYSIFAPPKLTKTNNKTNNATPASNIGNTSIASSKGFSVSGSCSLRKSFDSTRKKSPSSASKTENIYATIEEEDMSENHDYSDLASHSNNSGCSTGGGSGGKKRKLSPGADLPQRDIKPSQQSTHPIKPLTPSKSYRLADRDLENSPHRHMSSSSSRARSRLDYTSCTQPAIKTGASVISSQTKLNSNTLNSSEQFKERTELNSNRSEAVPTSSTKETVTLPRQSLSRTLPKPPVLHTSKTTSQTNQALPLRKPDSNDYDLLQKIEENSQLEELYMSMAANISRFAESQLKNLSPISCSMPVINNIETVTTNKAKSESGSKERKIQSQSGSKDSLTSESASKGGKLKNKKSSSKTSLSPLEKQSQGKSQSLPEIPTASKEVSQVKKGIKPKAQSDNRETNKHTSGDRKPLAQIQNGANITIPNRASISNRKHGLSNKTNISRKSKPLSPIEQTVPLMQSTPALPDCRKLLRFESTGAKPKLKTQDNDSAKTKKKKPLSPVESNSPDENQSVPVIDSTPVQVNHDESMIIVTGGSIMESRLRERIGRYDADALRSGKENLAFARMFDVLSPTDSFVSSLAFQVTYERRNLPQKPPRIPITKFPTMSVSKIPRNMVANNVAKFSNGSDS